MTSRGKSPRLSIAQSLIHLLNYFITWLYWSHLSSLVSQHQLSQPPHSKERPKVKMRFRQHIIQSFCCSFIVFVFFVIYLKWIFLFQMKRWVCSAFTNSDKPSCKMQETKIFRLTLQNPVYFLVCHLYLLLLVIHCFTVSGSVTR